MDSGKPRSERDTQGRFLPGNTLCKRGNPQAKFQVRNRAIFRKNLTPEAMDDVCKAIVADAVKGDKEARKIVMEYGMGRPTQDDINLDAYVAAMQFANRETGDLLRELLKSAEIRAELRRMLAAFEVTDAG